MARKANLAHLYNPQILDKKELAENFVVRLDIFKRLYNETSSTKMQYPEQHYLIQGKQGTGKTTLLLRLCYALENDPKLKKWMLPIVFNEEEYGIRRLYKFWIRLSELLSDKDEQFKGLNQQVLQLSEQFSEDNEFEREAFKLIADQLKQKGKKLVLFIDNFGDLLNKFNMHEAHRLRKILQTSSEIRIFAASSSTIEAFHDYKHPFYEFFKIEHLRGLNAEQNRELFINLADRYNIDNIKSILDERSSQIEVMRRLTGGSIRLMVILFEVLSQDQSSDAFSMLECLLDRTTPLYKNRMDRLPPQQQEIVEAIAHRWDAVSVKEIGERTRMGSKIISAQLNQLVKNEMVFKIHTNTKNHYYQINDRFFNIWYLVRLARNGSVRRVRRMVSVLNYWCNQVAHSPNWSSEIELFPQPGSSNLSDSPQFKKLFDKFAACSNQQFEQLLISFCPEFLKLLSLNEYDVLLAFFRHPRAKELKIADQLKPLYYTLMYALQEEYPNDHLRMGRELDQTIDEILDYVTEVVSKRA